MSHHLVAVEDLHFTYPDGVQALDGVSFRIHHGESVALAGPNGAGKSTLLMHLNGILAPSQGVVRVGDYPLTPETLREARRAVGMVFQDPDDQLFMPTVAEDVAFGPLNLGLTPDQAGERVEAALAQVGASHLRNRPPHRLSGGEKRSVAIATVLALDPAILVMDEPSSNLDPRSRRTLIGLLQGFAHTKIVATHDLDLALEVCERVIILAGGKVAADGPARDIFRDDALLASCGLERPLRLQGCPVCGNGGTDRSQAPAQP